MTVTMLANHEPPEVLVAQGARVGEQPLEPHRGRLGHPSSEDPRPDRPGAPGGSSAGGEVDGSSRCLRCWSGRAHGGRRPRGGLVSEKPNILIIWGDDIGISNLSCYSDGLMGYRTPNIDRIAAEGVAVHRLLRRAELHGRAGGVHHRAEPLPDRPDQGRHAGCRHRPARRGPDHRHGAEVARLRDRAVRQEPLRRPRRVPARPCTASTSSSATSTTSTPRRSPSSTTTRPRRSSRTSGRTSARAASSTPGRTATAPSASRTPGR